MGKNKSNNDEPKKRRCPACNGNGGRWIVKDEYVQGDGKRRPGKQSWETCRSCGGSGEL